MTIRYTYDEHKVRDEAKYVCPCGYKFKRVETSGWTENPYNEKWVSGDIAGLNETCHADNLRRLAKRACPKCGTAYSMMAPALKGQYSCSTEKAA